MVGDRQGRRRDLRARRSLNRPRSWTRESRTCVPWHGDGPSRAASWPVPPDSLAVTYLAGTPRYLSALKIGLPDVPRARSSTSSSCGSPQTDRQVGRGGAVVAASPWALPIVTKGGRGLDRKVRRAGPDLLPVPPRPTIWRSHGHALTCPRARGANSSERRPNHFTAAIPGLHGGARPGSVRLRPAGPRTRGTGQSQRPPG